MRFLSSKRMGVKSKLCLFNKTSFLIGVIVGAVLLVALIQLKLRSHALSLFDVRQQTTYRPPPSTVLSQDGLPPRGHFSSLLWDQGMAHDQFHLQPMKDRILNLVRKYNRIAVVGVSGGSEVLTWARRGYEVHAFEPMAASIDHLRKNGKGLSDMIIHHVAATNTNSGFMTVKYKPMNWTARVKQARVDSKLHGKAVDVLSVDVQGAEWPVLEGAMKLLETPGKVRSLWVELFPCGKNNLRMLYKLDALGYVLFDMIPLGATRSTGQREAMNMAPDAVKKGWNKRPSNFKEHFKHMCWVKRKYWIWYATDILAIQRELVTPQMLHEIKFLTSTVLA